MNQNYIRKPLKLWPGGTTVEVGRRLEASWTRHEAFWERLRVILRRLGSWAAMKSPRKISKIQAWRYQNRGLEASWRRLGASWGVLEAFWGVLGSLEPFGGRLGSILGRLGGVLGSSWRRPGALLGASWGV